MLGKSRTQKVKQEIDKNVAAQSNANMGLARMLAGLGWQPYEGVDVAAATPMMETAMNAPNLAASAFGMPTAEVALPEGAVEGPAGIPGFSSFDLMKESSPEQYTGLMDFLNKFSRTAAKRPRKA